MRGQVEGVIPKPHVFHQRGEESPDPAHNGQGDPSLRLRNGYAQDDAESGQLYH